MFVFQYNATVQITCVSVPV